MDDTSSPIDLWNNSTYTDPEGIIYVWDDDNSKWNEIGNLNNLIYDLSHESVDMGIEIASWDKAMKTPFIKCLNTLHEFFILRILNIITSRKAKKIASREYYAYLRKPRRSFFRRK